ncbi:MAG: S41 family peptidase [Chloroflexota bacterium]
MQGKRTIFQRVRQFQLAVLVGIIFIVGYAVGTQQTISQAQSDPPPEVLEDFQVLFEAYNLIETRYIDEVPVEDLVAGAIDGMVDALGDPYSDYVEQDYYELYNNDLSGEIEGIGVVITEVEGDDTSLIIEIVEVLADTPAERAGLQAGDVFVAVDGENVVGLTSMELAVRVRGPARTEVDLTMRRDGELLDFSVERARVLVPNVEFEVLENDIAYISMTQFTSMARNQIDSALEAVDVNSRRGLILDLRGNTGGFLSAAVDVGGLLMPEGVLLIEEFADGSTELFKVREGQVIRVRDDGTESVYSSNAAYAGIQVPVVVLLDEWSASATELVAGAWRDNNVAMLVGETTFGKGTVQVLTQLSNGGGVRLTIARWLTPNGISISEQGIVPDVVVEIPEDAELADDEDPQLDAAIDLMLQLTAETVP